MELDFSLIQHNYIKRLVIFAIFLYKNQRRNEVMYVNLVHTFVAKRLSIDIELDIDVGPKMDKSDVRNVLLEDILGDNDRDVGIMNLVILKFRTGHKEEILQINLNEEEKYLIFLDS
jgi:hypothetical protein